MFVVGICLIDKIQLCGHRDCDSSVDIILGHLCKMTVISELSEKTGAC